MTNVQWTLSNDRTLTRILSPMPRILNSNHISLFGDSLFKLRPRIVFEHHSRDVTTRVRGRWGVVILARVVVGREARARFLARATSYVIIAFIVVFSLLSLSLLSLLSFFQYRYIYRYSYLYSPVHVTLPCSTSPSLRCTYAYTLHSQSTLQLK